MGAGMGTEAAEGAAPAERAEAARAAREARRAAWQGHLAMFAFSLLVAGSFSFGALIAGDIAPGVLMLLRFALGACLMGALVLAIEGRAGLRLAAPWRFVLLGAVFAGYFVAMFEALRIADPVSLAAVFTLTPLMSALLARPVLGQRTPARVWAALLIGAAGAVWVIFRADLAALMAFRLGRGEALFLAGSFLHALYVPLLRRMNRGEGPLAATFGVLVGGALVLAVYAAHDFAATDWAVLPGRVWWVLGYLMVFATTTTFALVQFAAMRLPSSKVLAYTYLTPSWVILWEVVLGHGAPPVAVLGGVALSLAALAVLLGRDR